MDFHPVRGLSAELTTMPSLASETVRLLAELTGIVVTEKDRPSLQDYVQKQITTLGLVNEAQYCDRLKRSYRASRPQDEEWTQLIHQVTNGESYFFRDPGQLKLIGETLLPELIERRRKSLRDGLIDHLYLNLWSAGCSTGEEPYSLAIMLKESLVDFENWRIHLIATDINPAAIAQAQTGCYRNWSLRQIPPRYRTQYFRPIDGAWQIAATLRSLVQWDVLNLKDPDAIARRIPWASMDLILCRNVFIYFGREAIAQILQQFQTALSPEGYLLVGHAELEGQDLSAFSLRHEVGSVVYQRGVSEKTQCFV